jgi:hypothetical protein
MVLHTQLTAPGDDGGSRVTDLCDDIRHGRVEPRAGLIGVEGVTEVVRADEEVVGVANYLALVGSNQ